MLHSPSSKAHSVANRNTAPMGGFPRLGLRGAPPTTPVSRASTGVREHGPGGLNGRRTQSDAQRPPAPAPPTQHRPGAGRGPLIPACATRRRGWRCRRRPLSPRGRRVILKPGDKCATVLSAHARGDPRRCGGGSVGRGRHQGGTAGVPAASRNLRCAHH